MEDAAEFEGAPQRQFTHSIYRGYGDDVNNTVNTIQQNYSGYENDYPPEKSEIKKEGGQRSLTSSRENNNNLQRNSPAFFSGFTFYSFDFANIQPLSLLGEGNFGSVWKCLYRNNNATYAVKYLRVRRKSERIIHLFRSMFHEISCALPNRNVVRHFGCFTGDFSEFGIVMEYMEKGSLESALKSDQTLISSLPLRLQIAVDIARGMNSLHSSSPSIIHLDLRSSNVLLDHNYCAKIGDFGVSISKSKGMDVEGEYEAKGFIQCMAPEVFAGLINKYSDNPSAAQPRKNKSRYSCKADVYSFGLLLLELLTGKNVFAGWPKHSIKFSLTHGFLRANPLPFPSYFPPTLPGLVELGERCLDGVAENRPSFAEIVLTLERILSISPSVVMLSQYSPLLSILSHYEESMKEESREREKEKEERWANTKDEEGRTMLHYAAMRGDVEIVRYLLHHSAHSILFDKIELKTPLHYACLYGNNVDVVALLIKHMRGEFELLSEDERRQCGVEKSSEVVDIIEGKNGMTSLHLASLGSNVEVLSHLVNSEGAALGKRDFSNANLLHHCARNGSMACLRVIFHFLSSLPSPNRPPLPPLPHSDAKQEDNAQEIEREEERGRREERKAERGRREEEIGIGSKDALGRSPLHYAAFCGNSDLISLLLQYGADPNSADNNGMTAMAGVCFYNHVDCLRVLLSSSASPLVVDHFGVSPLQCAVYLGNEEIVRQLITLPGIDIHHPNGDDNACLHLAAINGNVRICEMLVEMGAEVDKIGCSKMTPLIQTAIGGHVDCAKYLLAHSANPNFADERGMTSLHWACYMGHYPMVKLLAAQLPLNINAITFNRQNALHFAIALGAKNLKLISLLLSFPELNKDQQDEEGVTPLLQACAQNEPDIVRLLVDARCDVNERSNSGATALHLAVTRKSIDIAKILLSSPFLILSPVDNFGCTPIAYAMIARDFEMVTLLARSHPST